MKLRKVDSYNIGLDIGTGSVGWAVVDQGGELCSFKGKHTWGSRLFPSAQTAEEARVHRGQRRRYDRRRQRLDLLQGFFAEEVGKVDPDFFIRLNQSRLLKEDRDPGHADYRWPLFNGAGGISEPDYYKRFPTIYHLRAHLVDSCEKEDIRLVYLALHNIVKHRGNFLHQDNPGLSAKNADVDDAVTDLGQALESWCEANDIEIAFDVEAIAAALDDPSLSTAEKRERVEKALGIEKPSEKMASNIAKAIVGYSADFAQIFGIEASEGKFALSNDERVEGFPCPDDGLDLYEALKAAYSAFVLKGILKNAEGKTISFCKVGEYERYRDDLKMLKDLVRDYVPEKYDEFFRGAVFERTRLYDPSKAEGYTKYDLGSSKMSHDDFLKEVGKLFKGSSAEGDGRYLSMMERIEEKTFLRRLKTSDNGAIPYQLHREEMDAIIENQKAYYPFLGQEKEKIESLVTFRIPYYVGPLTRKNAREAADGSLRFAWSERLEGAEGRKIYPWNWEEVIDRDKSAEAFIRRMTGTCTYLQGEPVLPRCSLMYEMYCVLNELNGARWTQDGDKEYRFDFADRAGIVEDLFKRSKTVSYQIVGQWLEKKHGPNGERSMGGGYRVRGGQGEAGFESKLSSYVDFCKILGVDEIPEDDIPMVEDLILWNTVFEDRSILKRKIKQEYGDRLSTEQIGKVCRKRYTGWGRLSRKLLSGIRVETDNGPKSIMDILEEGDPNNTCRLGAAMNLMEILHDDQLGFGKKIDQINNDRPGTSLAMELADLPGSPALRRGVNQALRIVEEISGIASKPPASIFIEVTRDEDPRKKGKRTTRRYNQVKQALASLKKQYADVYSQLEHMAPQKMDDRRVMLYFMQCGKSMYSGKPLDINRLSDYQIDHVLPQSYIKDDSLENTVLVLRDENQRKLDSMFLDQSIISKMGTFWKELHRVGLIGDKKLRNLMRAEQVSDSQMKSFINRQLVETSQIVKRVQQMLRERYPETDVQPVKAGMSHQLRVECELAKCREANDYHHAHDAYLAAEIGRFIQYRHGDAFENPTRMAKTVRAFIRKQAENLRYRRDMPGSAGFVVSSFLSSGFDKETGVIFDDAWDAEVEVGRIRRSLDYRDCFISRMPEETSGAFWDATIYSPRETKKTLSLPLKKGLDPKKYGSYSREQFAYFFVYEAFKGAKRKRTVEFAPVPVRVANALKSDESELERYAMGLAEAKGLSFSRILKRKVLKYQMIELSGDRLYITGLKEVRNARQFAFSNKETKLLCRVVDGGECSDEVLDGLFERIQELFGQHAARLGRQLRIEDIARAYHDASLSDKGNVIVSLLEIASAKRNMIDLSSLGMGSALGCMRLTHSKELVSGSNGYYFIDQSVTGMFERRYKLGL